VLTVLGLLAAYSVASAQDSMFQLIVPFQGTAQDSLTKMEELIKARGGQEKARSGTNVLVYVSYALGGPAEPMLVDVSTNPTSTNLSLSCASYVHSGGAEELCRDLVRRYNAP
jgi:hypothetical protein